jgi:hypothetical protein
MDDGVSGAAKNTGDGVRPTAISTAARAEIHIP